MKGISYMRHIGLDIAGISFIIRSDGLDFFWAFDEDYSAFRNEVSGQPDIDILLVGGAMPDAGEMPMLFDAGGPWKLYRSTEGQYFFSLGPSFLDEPICVARFDAHPSRVTLHCGKALFERTPEGLAVKNPFTFPIDRILMMYYLCSIGGVFVHGAALGIGQKGFVFPGISGAGKSTLARLLLDQEGFCVLTDERAALKKHQDGFHVYGTPWHGELRVALNKGYPLAGMLFLEKGPRNAIRGISPKEAFRRLFPTTYLPLFDKEVLPGALSSIDEILSRVPAYVFEFLPGADVAQALREHSEGAS